MRVKAICNLGTKDYPDCALLEGEEADVTETAGRAMVSAGHAVAITEPVKPEPVPEVKPIVQEPVAAPAKEPAAAPAAAKTSKKQGA